MQPAGDCNVFNAENENAQPLSYVVPWRARHWWPCFIFSRKSWHWLAGADRYHVTANTHLRCNVSRPEVPADRTCGYRYFNRTDVESVHKPVISFDGLLYAPKCYH